LRPVIGADRQCVDNNEEDRGAEHRREMTPPAQTDNKSSPTLQRAAMCDHSLLTNPRWWNAPLRTRFGGKCKACAQSDEARGTARSTSPSRTPSPVRRGLAR
jgi:hypothetical protein